MKPLISWILIQVQKISFLVAVENADLIYVTRPQGPGQESIRSNVVLLNPDKDISETCRRSDTRVSEHRITSYL